MQPIPLFPIIAAYCNGLLVRLCNIYCHYLMVSWTCLMVSQISALVWCFALKHRTIGLVTSGRIISNYVYFSGGIFSIISPALTFWACYNTGISRSIQMEYVEKNYPEYFQKFKNLQNFSIYEIDGWFVIVLFISSFGMFFSGFTFTFTTIDMRKMLRGLKLKVSGKSYKRYEMAVRSLLAQFAASSLCLAPPFALMLLAVGKFEKGQSKFSF
ncbi:Protein CBG26171 [Caenorhabditis briggsae]|uniref:Protein CBG26171 n=1 Tax=Caenorhabditis briggsae TaxID=6238 RepID=B6ILA7_CAEBR|nr:Protein CBG26171 [Caenorhabditis briggsae]CAS00687.1 Protein CBG26171 [Caenorhabditis briggsae]